MKKMLFNATHSEEFRVAIIDGQQLIELDLEPAIRTEKKGNIYKSVVTKVEPGLEAAFVDYGGERQGFLPLKEIYHGYFAKYDPNVAISKVKIADSIKEGQELVVQVDRDEVGNKGAALTTFISLAGRFLVLMPNNPKGGGVSRRISGEERLDLRRIMTDLNVSDKHALIARTAGIGHSTEELQWDLDFLLKLWDMIKNADEELTGPRLIYQESNLIVRSIRDHLAAEIVEIIVDDEEIYERAKRFMQQVMPQNISKLKYYNDNIPLFSRYQIEHQIEAAFNRTLNLPSGGSLVIDHTEALISVDVNSARSTKGADIEETALKTNLEAADEVARQLRIRDIGGLIVIDFIDMTVDRNKLAVESRLNTVVKRDRARVQVGKISRFGLMEMSRQRLRTSISEASYQDCEHCSGTGSIRNVVSASIALLRLMEEKALSENTEALQVNLSIDMAIYLMNEKRYEIDLLEKRSASRIILIPSNALSSSQYEIKHLRSSEIEALGDTPSYMQSVKKEQKEKSVIDDLRPAPMEQPYISPHQVNHAGNYEHLPKKAIKETVSNAGKGEPGWLARLWKKLIGAETKKNDAAKESPPKNSRGRGRSPSRQTNSNRRQPQQRMRGGGQVRRTQGTPSSRPPKNSRPTQPRKENRAGSNDTGQSAASTNSQKRNDSNKPENNTTPPTRSDFAAHDPNDRVGQRNPRNKTNNQTARHPNTRDATEKQDIPDDIGNR